MKEETKYRMIEYKKICMTLIIVFILFKGDNFEKSICHLP